MTWRTSSCAFPRARLDDVSVLPFLPADNSGALLPSAARGCERAAEIVARIGAGFEATRTRDDARFEVPVANGSGSTFGNRPSGL